MKKTKKKQDTVDYVDDDTGKTYTLTWDEYVNMPFNVRLRRLSQ